MKFFKIFIFLFLFHKGVAQNMYPNSGEVKLDANLKIGNQISPNTEGEIVRLSLQPYRHTGGPWNFKSRDNSNVAFLDIDYGNFGTALTISSDRNLAVGTSNPISKLTIGGSLTINGGLSNSQQRPLITASTLTSGEIRGYSSEGNEYDDGFLRLSAGGGTHNFVKTYIDLSGYSTVPDLDRNIVFGTGGIERLRVHANGNVGIGTTTPDSKLAVKGTIHSQAVKVDMNGWSDFVFKKNYDLPTLEEVEKHIIEKGHLENIPNEEEVLKNGINLGEMNAKLLQKIEEMTLYIIQQEKQIKEQAKEITSFQNALERLSKIEEKLEMKE